MTPPSPDPEPVAAEVAVARMEFRFRIEQLPWFDVVTDVEGVGGRMVALDAVLAAIDRPVSAFLIGETTLDAARSAPPITATALAEALHEVAGEFCDPFDADHPVGMHNSQAAAILAALPVREDGPTGIDGRAFDEALGLIGELVGYLHPWTSVEEEGEAELHDRARAFLTREASHVR